ncbi:MAG: DUF1097 domain-containing protein [Eubacteriales bacterium]
MGFLTAVGITIGVLAGIWAQVSGYVGLLAWVGFIAWACFFAAGGKTDGLVKGMLANLSGVFWGWLIIMIMGLMPNFPYALGVAVVFPAFMMCVQANFKYLSFIPGAFCGAAAYFGSGLDIKATAISLICGALLAFASEWLALKMTKKEAAAEESK